MRARVTRWLLIAAVAACRSSPEGIAIFDTTATYVTFPDPVPMEPYRDTLLGVEFLRPQGLHVLRINRTCTDTFPAPYHTNEWDDGGDPTIAVSLTRAPLATVADDRGIVATPEGWTAYGRGSYPHHVNVAVGSRWRLLSGSMGVGVPLEGGGWATDDREVKVAVVDRGDRCALAVTSNLAASELTDAATDWHMLESIRFLDRQGRALATVGWLDTLPPARRVGFALRGAFDGACLAIGHDSVQLGTAITMIEFLSGQQRVVSYGVVRGDRLDECADAKPEPGMSHYNVEIVRTPYASVNAAIAVLGAVTLDTTGNALRADVNGDGVPERFGICSTADGSASWAWLITEITPAPTVTWQRRVSAPDLRWSACTAGVRSLLY